MKIREGGLWLVQNLNANPMCEKDKKIILEIIRKTKEYLSLLGINV